MSQQPFESKHFLDEHGLPAGGVASAVGIDIYWQNGPLGRGKDRSEPNGAFVETVLAIVIDRLNWYQTVGDERFACRENGMAIVHATAALRELERRTARREMQRVEGTHEVGQGDGGFEYVDPNADAPAPLQLSPLAVAKHKPIVGAAQWDNWVSNLTPVDIAYINDQAAAGAVDVGQVPNIPMTGSGELITTDPVVPDDDLGFGIDDPDYGGDGSPDEEFKPRGKD